jgi:putative FmdB family regulatory protein
MTYTYECSSGHLLEIEQSIKAEPLTHCETCGAECRRVILRAPAFQLRGFGWSNEGYDKHHDENLP